VAQESLTAADLTRVIETDGELGAAEFTLENARMLADAVWGQGFPAPLFQGEFNVQSQRLVGEKHLKLRLTQPYTTRAAFRPTPSCFSGHPAAGTDPGGVPPGSERMERQTSLQLNLAHWSAA
jgi:single-stranded-DNA-specific exonuclease